MGTLKLKRTLICGSSEYSKSLLFESAVHWSELGHKVVFIQVNQMTALPIPIDGAKPPSVQALNRITFLTLSSWQDLVQYTSSIHETSPIVPHVILVSDLHNYYSNEDLNQSLLAHMLCACLCDVMEYCSRVNNSETFLVVTTKDTELETKKLSTIYFPLNTWTSVVKQEELELTKTLLNFQNTNIKIKFLLFNNKIRCDSIEKLYV
ncbi:uncharacterized protein LOC126893804 [Daktulosphaira vitifoliae]|uniref:uncharacterized protein LOC126893804 n=1 Tax=Daktulosphaira vitifoliae TaxID=58002 RepID=UPI0021A9B0CC|nr:uncharacterized protein LOC126893804 [Daktulosphaira vitifoliae]